MSNDNNLPPDSRFLGFINKALIQHPILILIVVGALIAAMIALVSATVSSARADPIVGMPMMSRVEVNTGFFESTPTDNGGPWALAGEPAKTPGSVNLKIECNAPDTKGICRLEVPELDIDHTSMAVNDDHFALEGELVPLTHSTPGHTRAWSRLATPTALGTGTIGQNPLQGGNAIVPAPNVDDQMASPCSEKARQWTRLRNYLLFQLPGASLLATAARAERLLCEERRYTEGMQELAKVSQFIWRYKVGAENLDSKVQEEAVAIMRDISQLDEQADLNRRNDDNPPELEKEARRAEMQKYLKERQQ